MGKPEKFLFICVNKREEGHPKGSCSLHGANDLAVRFKEAFTSRGVEDTCMLVKSCCLGPCHLGPIAVVLPENIWYKELTPSDVDEIVDKHIIGGVPVQRKIMIDKEIS